MAEVAGLQTVQLAGTPRERGRIHGEALRPLISRGIRRWRGGILASTELDPDDYLDRFLESCDFLPAIERWAPHLLDEVRGIGEGAGIPFRDVYAYQLMDEEWHFRRTLAGEQEGRELDHCSTIAVFGERGAPPLLAQNMDLPKIYDGTQALLHVRHHDTAVESFVFTPAGLLGTTGLNSWGVGICCNTLAQLGHTSRGLPVAFVVRHVLEHRAVVEAERFLQAVPHASGQNYMIGGPSGIVDLECSANKVVPCMYATTRLYHTNHPIANDDQPWRSGDVSSLAPGRGSASTDAPATVLSNSEQRFSFLANALADMSERITVDRAKSILSTCEVPISVARSSKGDGMTLGSLVMQLSSPPLLDLAAGPPAETTYSRWTFS